MERADLDPRVHVMLLSGHGKGFCGGYDLDLFAENLDPTAAGAAGDQFGRRGAVLLDPVVQAPTITIRSPNSDPMLTTR